MSKEQRKAKKIAKLKEDRKEWLQLFWQTKDPDLKADFQRKIDDVDKKLKKLGDK